MKKKKFLSNNCLNIKVNDIHGSVQPSLLMTREMQPCSARREVIHIGEVLCQYY
jgi:hypothetical protein